MLSDLIALQQMNAAGRGPSTHGSSVSAQRRVVAEPALTYGRGCLSPSPRSGEHDRPLTGVQLEVGVRGVDLATLGDRDDGAARWPRRCLRRGVRRPGSRAGSGVRACRSRAVACWECESPRAGLSPRIRRLPRPASISVSPELSVVASARSTSARVSQPRSSPSCESTGQAVAAVEHELPARPLEVLVGEQHLRLARERHRTDEALPHARRRLRRSGRPGRRRTGGRGRRVAERLHHVATVSACSAPIAFGRSMSIPRRSSLVV